MGVGLKQWELVAVDMDGVLADFISAAMRVNGGSYHEDTYPRGLWDVESHLGVSRQQFWRTIDATPYFWERLQPYPWLRRVMELALAWGEEVIVLSTPSIHPASRSGKTQWFYEHIRTLDLPGIEAVDLHLGAKKKWLSGEGRLLIDDQDSQPGKPGNCEQWRERGGCAILFPQPWNGAWESRDLLFREWGVPGF